MPKARSLRLLAEKNAISFSKISQVIPFRTIQLLNKFVSLNTFIVYPFF